MDLSDEEFRSIGVSQKTSYIKALSLAVLSKNIDLESLVNKTPDRQVGRTYQNQRDRKLDYRRLFNVLSSSS
jgi:hypothetical protein